MDKADEAIRMVGFTDFYVHKYPFFKDILHNCKEKKAPNYHHKTFKI